MKIQPSFPSSAHRKHNCYHYIHTVYFVQPIMVGRRCSVCGCVTNAQYRSRWKRLLAVFMLDEWWDRKFQDTRTGE